MEERSYKGFLHRHPGMELKKGLKFEEHVIVNRHDWEIARHDTKESPGTASNIPRNEIRLIAESIISAIDYGNYRNAKILAESIIAELSPVG